MNTATIYINSKATNRPLHQVQVFDGRNINGMTRSDLKAQYRAYLLEIRTRRMLPVMKGLTWHTSRRRMQMIRWELNNLPFIY